MFLELFLFAKKMKLLTLRPTLMDQKKSERFLFFSDKIISDERRRDVIYGTEKT